MSIKTNTCTNSKWVQGSEIDRSCSVYFYACGNVQNPDIQIDVIGASGAGISDDVVIQYDVDVSQSMYIDYVQTDSSYCDWSNISDYTGRCYPTNGVPSSCTASVAPNIRRYLLIGITNLDNTSCLDTISRDYNYSLKEYTTSISVKFITEVEVSKKVSVEILSLSGARNVIVSCSDGHSDGLMFWRDSVGVSKVSVLAESYGDYPSCVVEESVVFKYGQVLVVKTGNAIVGSLFTLEISSISGGYRQDSQSLYVHLLMIVFLSKIGLFYFQNVDYL